jgi:hypothetical protein
MYGPLTACRRYSPPLASKRQARFGKAAYRTLVVPESGNGMQCVSAGNKSQPGYVFWLKLLSAKLTGRCQEYD